MNNFAKLFELLELTRSQPQYGYALAGIRKADLSDLAQHHYLVAMVALQLARYIQREGGNLDIEKVLEFALIHDLGELFGGDIAMPYAKANPKAREFAKAFEAENQKYLAKYFGKYGDRILELGDEILDAKSDEALIAKLADYIEVTHYKKYMDLFSKGDAVMAVKAMETKLAKLHDKTTKRAVKRFIAQWKKDLLASKTQEFFEQAKF